MISGALSFDMGLFLSSIELQRRTNTNKEFSNSWRVCANMMGLFDEPWPSGALLCLHVSFVFLPSVFLRLGDKVDRMTAQAEMDAYLSNPNDWAYNRLQGYKVDYLSLDQKQLTLNLVWAVFIVSLLSRGVFCAVTGDYFFSFIPGAHSSNSL
jgi:hypothetical protein